MVFHTADVERASTVGDPTPVDLDRTASGRINWVRVTSVAGNVVSIDPPLSERFPAAGSQVIVVPEYTTVSIGANAVLTAPAWDGAVGGVVVFLATGEVQLEGTISASELGFRGGNGEQQDAQPMGCTGLTETPQRGARRGEGLVPPGDGSTSGRGNSSSGGGGGVCDSSGGGGGGHQGQGGQGGVTWDGQRSVGGMGGARVTESNSRLVFGGGGGAGFNEYGATSVGGAGGGLILIRALGIRGAGRLLAQGAAGASTGTGCGGGGAGGTVSISADFVDCLRIDASGGSGGSMVATVTPHGTGGGGGGGLIRVETNQLVSTCVTKVAHGLAGIAGGLLPDAGPLRFAGATPAEPMAINEGRVVTILNDAGMVPSDAGTADSDASDRSDAGERSFDASVRSDAGETSFDAGERSDAGTVVPRGPASLSVACQCLSSEGGALVALAWICTRGRFRRGDRTRIA
jgi:hypothetical protein